MSYTPVVPGFPFPLSLCCRSQLTASQANEKLLECGSTCTAAVVQGSCVALADVGDSQAVLG